MWGHAGQNGEDGGDEDGDDEGGALGGGGLKKKKNSRSKLSKKPEDFQVRYKVWEARQLA